MQQIKVYTNSTFNDSIEIISYLQPVTYHIVLGVNFFADWLSSWTDLVGGKSQSYQSRLSTINKEVIEGIQTKVFQLGGNAAIDLKIDNDEISAQGKSMIMVTAIATAVIIKEKSKTAPLDLPKKGVQALTNQDYLRYKQRLEIKQSIRESKNIGPLNSLIPGLQSEYYDLITELFQAINHGDFDPRDFIKESFVVIREMIDTIDSDSRSVALYNNLEFINDENNEVDYRVVKCLFYLNLVESTNCVDFKCINNILPKATERLKQYFIEHYAKGLDMKSIYYPSDTEDLKKGIQILESIGANKDDYFEVLSTMIKSLEEFFN